LTSFRKIAYSIAGFDPSAGAGLLADIKTMESLLIYGYGINTANTIQNSKTFESINWVDKSQVVSQLNICLREAKPNGIKVGLVHDFKFLIDLIKTIKGANPQVRIVWDPVLSASAGKLFHRSIDQILLKQIAGLVDLITPNKPEAEILFGSDKKEALANLNLACTILLKGGHASENLGTDYLITDKEVYTLPPTLSVVNPKHGSGCILSSAILSYYLTTDDLHQACSKAKVYTEQAMASNQSLLAYHS